MAQDDAAPVATIVLSDEAREEIASRLGLAADQFDAVPTAIELSIDTEEPEVEGFANDTPAPTVRPQVRALLSHSAAFQSLPPDRQQDIAKNTVRIL